ncbi:HPr family phosphocarrier protein [Amycolatopsis alkalitolerans]|uniref:Phosphocarrier protein HPr n=1 Tax=Amycolatopsis alkalitolerans TaxID=2547244 RepID=A0A5C4M262_9PSEU|nr:HPr family phosphocarrier protein [Amycolatopsis alkalitolerans]TNC26997.1 HPr family phosphocarrier protein [Amycolatopsis alkalitolerans]
MPERLVIVGSPVGLHARPAALFVKAAAAQPVPVTIGVGEGAPVDARSLLSVMGLGARGGDEVVLRADGPGAEAALAALATVVAADHDS